MENNKPLKEKEVVVIDVETSMTSCQDYHVSVSGKKCITRLLSKPCSEFLGFKGSERGKSSVIVNENREDSVDILIENNLHSEENLALLHGKDKRKTRNGNKTARKPPRPPKGPSLNASDFKLIKEITELTMKKRARIEHTKSLKKMKAAKSLPSSLSPSSSNTTLTAMFVTAIFCFVIILQGFYSRGTPTMSFQGSPEPSINPEGLISVQFYNLSPYAMVDWSSDLSPSPYIRSARQRLLFQGSSHRDRIIKRN